jgi:hypothetical protein
VATVIWCVSTVIAVDTPYNCRHTI